MISGIINANPTICEHILQDLNRGKSEAQRAGAKGMSAEQVLRCVVVKILFGFTYEDLAFHIVDSQSLRWFCRIGMAEEGFRMLAIMNAKNEKKRKSEYIDLLKITGKVLGYARTAAEMIKDSVVAPSCVALLADIEHYARLAEKVIDQTHRRVVLDEKVAAADAAHRHHYQGPPGDDFRPQNWL